MITSARDSPGTIVVRQFYYPGWQARLANDGTWLAVRPTSHGLLAIEVPGGTHDIVIGLPAGALERGGQALSGGSLVVALLLLFRRRTRLAVHSAGGVS